MRVLIRLVAITLAGAVLYYAGVVNAIVIYRPSGYGAVLVVLGIALSGAMLVVAMLGDGRGEAETAAFDAGGVTSQEKLKNITTQQIRVGLRYDLN